MFSKPTGNDNWLDDDDCRQELVQDVRAWVDDRKVAPGGVPATAVVSPAELQSEPLVETPAKSTAKTQVRGKKAQAPAKQEETLQEATAPEEQPAPAQASVNREKVPTDDQHTADDAHPIDCADLSESTNMVNPEPIRRQPDAGPDAAPGLMDGAAAYLLRLAQRSP